MSDAADIAFRVIVLIFVALIALVIYAFWHEANSEKIEITKADWECTKTESNTQWMLVGKILVPQTFHHCVEYKKNGD